MHTRARIRLKDYAMLPVTERPANTAAFDIVLNGLKMGRGIIDITTYGKASDNPTAVIEYNPSHTPPEVLKMIHDNTIID